MSPKLPAPYAWLANETGPKVLLEALALFGTKETPGSASNPVILGWAREVGVARDYANDGIAWCGLFVAAVVKRAGFEPVKAPLWARNWGTWGTKAAAPSLGDVLVFERAGGGGHVGFYVGEDATAYHVLGGNQSDQVCVSRILKSRCLAVRRCPWKFAQPANVRPVRLAAGGALSTNEA
ncbi:TIGR02594 family protein [Methylobacterium sp. 174MFSha1.1]|uniref:TIGR02594 family protein n=1 Tax=Methylobacterium sp. 174MFSha1.1 TaxID=1502749 RepID=UPI0008E2D7F2|nr:TIGR02594 family protein [Methylobacterium sp. 174MFSha1.1]SFU93326.1 TIGR02594 family protein [Methylobacterium sp. 174MFSha1.1]